MMTSTRGKRAKWSATVAVALVTVAPTSTVQPGTKADVYAALFSDHYWGLEPLSKLVVKRDAIPMPTIAGSSADWLRQWADIPQALCRVAEQSQPTASVRLASVLFPPGTRLVDESAIKTFFASEGRVEDKWPSFYRQFAAAGWVGFSDVVFTSEHTDALVYYEGRCGGLYGVGEYVWLQRGAASDWVVRKRIMSWVS